MEAGVQVREQSGGNEQRQELHCGEPVTPPGRLSVRVCCLSTSTRRWDRQGVGVKVRDGVERGRFVCECVCVREGEGGGGRGGWA